MRKYYCDGCKQFLGKTPDFFTQLKFSTNKVYAAQGDYHSRPWDINAELILCDSCWRKMPMLHNEIEKEILAERAEFVYDNDVPDLTNDVWGGAGPDWWTQPQMC